MEPLTRSSRPGPPRARVAAIAAIPAIIGAAGFALGVRRTEILSSGLILCLLGALAIPAGLLLFLSTLRRGPDRTGFAPIPLDLFFAAWVGVSLLSFLLASKSREIYFKPYLLSTAFVLYLLVRANRPRLGGRTAALLAGGLAATAGIEAVHGLVQGALGREMRGFFFNVNHFAVFLAMAFPVAWAATRQSANRRLRFLGLGLSAIVLAAVALSRCRTAYAALLVVGGASLFAGHLARRAAGATGPRPRAAAVRSALVFGAAALLVIAGLGASFKQMSAAGRILIWKVGFKTALSRPVTGIGYGNFPAVYGREQGRYFEEGHGSATERLSAGAFGYAFNDYLESFMETGLVGLLVLLPLWGLIFKAVGRALYRTGLPPPSPRLNPFPDKGLEAGAAGSVLAYIVIAAFYYPSQMLPLTLLFSALLGWIARADRPASVRIRSAAARVARVVGTLALAAAVLLLPTAWKRYRAHRSWAEAAALERAGRTTDALALSRAVSASLRSDELFAGFHAGLLLKAGEAEEAAAVLERATELSANPRLAEKLAAVRLELGRLEQALLSAREADASLPWRLTSKSLLAEIHLRRGDIGEASRCARLVLETPMKLRTGEGEALKTAAFDLLERIGPAPGAPRNPLLDLVADLPAENRGGVLGALQALGGRSAPYLDALRASDREERACLAFLLAKMPDRDLFGLEAGFLAENVRLALLARRTVPLASEVPDDVFLEFVLPYAASDEPRDPWRREFHEKFRDAVAASPSVEEAAVRLNRDVFTSFRLAFQERGYRARPLSPAQSIERGVVSCDDASILLVDACRSTGIPARVVILPRWPGTRRGHSWVEIWEGGRWRHLTAYDPGQLDRTWIPGMIEKYFRPGARNAIFAVRFGREEPRPLPGRDVPAVDVTGSYIQ